MDIADTGIADPTPVALQLCNGVRICLLTFRHHFLEISVAERVPEIPMDAQQDDLVSEVSSSADRAFGIPFTVSDHGRPVCDRSG
jgi:hypothetical protein